MPADLKKKSFMNLVVLVLLGVILNGCATIRPEANLESTAPDFIDSAGTVFSHDLLDAVLMRSVNDQGRVDYSQLKENYSDLDAYLNRVAAFSPDSHPALFPNRDHQLAYWLNAYNAYVIKAVLVHYPITSVLDVKTPALVFFLSDKAGFFLLQRFFFGGKTTSLYYLENQVIRKRFKDPRIHFVLNCASIGCPKLPRKAFSGANLNLQLDAETRKFVAESRNVRIDHKTQTIWLSSIFKWYKSDFKDGRTIAAPKDLPFLLAYIANYLPPAKARKLKDAAATHTTRFIPYDWGLNDRP